jgi:aromatic-L-amino-acid/L-tryptophan decarboxylase
MTDHTSLTLDPTGDWSAFRALGHRMVDDMVTHLSTLDAQPTWQPIPQAVRDALAEDLPMQGCGAEAAYESFREHVLPYPNGNLHPRFWGWVQGNGTPLAMLAEMLAAGMNPHLAGFDQAPAIVEHQVIDWLRQVMEFPESASGLLVSGGTMANTVALATARYAKAGFDVRTEGLQGAHAPMAFYGSTETHSWASKAAEFLGFGSNAFRAIEVDSDKRMRVDALMSQVEADRRAGLNPFCVIGTAGTVNTGACDDLLQLAQRCRDLRLWFHVDGAFGALAKLSPRFKSMVAGLELADSVAFDLHKWMYLPFESACVLVRDGDQQRNTFRSTAPYIAKQARGTIAGGLPFADLGLELTRNFKALKVWMSLKAHGLSTYRQLIEQNVDQAQYVKSKIEAHPALQLLAPVPLNIVCFRFVDASLDNEKTNALNQELLLRVQESGIAVCSSTILGEHFALRLAIVNHRSTLADFDRFLQAVLTIGEALLAKGL